jgi:hypothetical protein
MKSYVLLLTVLFFIALDGSPSRSISNGNGRSAGATPTATDSPGTIPKQPVLDDPVVIARTLIRDDDKAEQWADEKDPRVRRAAERIESIAKHSGERASAVMLAIDGTASRLKVTRVQLLEDVDGAVSKGIFKRGQGTTFGMDVWEWATAKYKAK